MINEINLDKYPIENASNGKRGKLTYIEDGKRKHQELIFIFY